MISSIAAVLWPLALVAVAALAYRFAFARLAAQNVTLAHADAQALLKTSQEDLDARLRVIEDKLRAEGRITTLGTMYGKR